MKKIFSLSLMAVALLISGNAKAATLTVGPSGSYLTLESAFSAANSGDVIQLVGEATVSQTIEINGKSLILDMNGHNAEMNTMPTEGMKKPWMFVIFKGALDVKGQGQILNSISNEGGYKHSGTEILTFKLFGSRSNVSNFTYLKIGKDVEVVADPGKCGINIDELNPIGSEKYTAIYGEAWSSDYRFMAYGVVVDIYGKVNGQKYGVQISGNLSKMDKNDKTNWPKVNIKPGSEVWSQPEENESVGFYAAGQGNSMVEGTVHASTGVYIKSGEVEIHDAYVYSDGTDEYTGPAAKGSGVDACGSAVVVDSKSGYAGAQKVVISGDTKLEGAKGYAIEEVITETKDGGTMVQAVTIEGGIIVGGEKGGMVFAEQTIAKEDQEGQKIVTVFEGTFEGTTTIGGQEQATPSILFPKGEDKHITIVDGMMVVSDGAAPAAATKDINELTENTDIQYTDARNMTLEKDLTFKVVELIGAETLTIPEGKTLKADKLVLGADAQVVVEVGAKLLIMGNAGVVSKYPDNLVLKANADGMGILVFNPNVQSNRSPMATVEYYLGIAKFLGNDQYDFELMSSPFMKISAISHNAPQGFGLSYQHFNAEQDKWEFCTKQQMIDNAKPFEAYAITTNSTEGGITVTFKGNLHGNLSGKISLKKGFNYIGNGFAAKMDVKQLVEDLSNNNKVKHAVYKWDKGAQNYSTYTGRTIDRAADLNGMEMFMLYANEDIDIIFDYEKLIWEENK